MLASAVYCSDKMVSRAVPITRDEWTRDLHLRVPVSIPTTWQTGSSELEDDLSFLTGDFWNLELGPLQAPLYLPRLKTRRRTSSIEKIRGDAVCLLSGGLDSVVGAIDWLEDNPDKSLLVVGHHDQHVKGPFGDQNNLIALLKQAYPDRVDALQIQVGQSPRGQEPSFRSRSLLFLSLGVHAAQALGEDIPLLIPENGTIAVNVPLTPSRRGSCSTRTAHPFFLQKTVEALRAVGLHTPIINPLALKTKGECVVQCRNPSLLAKAVPLTVSCAKAGHKSTWRSVVRAENETTS